MKRGRPQRRRYWLLPCLLLGGALGCNELVGIEAPAHRGEGGAGGEGPACGDPKAPVDKLDLLVAIDNSRGMLEKQEIFALALPELLRKLVNPPCIDPMTGAPQAFPEDPDAECPQGTEREIEPVRDLHIGIISSSLGSHGGNVCPSAAGSMQSNDDQGHLLARQDPQAPNEVESYLGLHFLAWDPGQERIPPGEADLAGDTSADPNDTALLPNLLDMVRGVGAIGCGYESQLESWYRFLVDPAPSTSVSIDQEGNLVHEGVDNVLLAQRKAFLRPDSMVMIVMLSDENDCSIKEYGQSYLVATLTSGGDPFHLPKPRSECAVDPQDECCFPCGQQGPLDGSGTPICKPDESCTDPMTGEVALLDNLTDNVNVRCFDQKRRFGVDYLYPIDRYTQALTACEIPDRSGQIVPNPLFSDLDPADGLSATRDPSLVVLAGIVGVPWQDVARTREDGVPDLLLGLDAKGDLRGGFKDATELLAPIKDKPYNAWDLILGEPASYPAPSALPKDPLMIESYGPRTGSHPVTGDALVTSAMPLGNPINGHEFTIAKQDDLQYACIFPVLPGSEKDCTESMQTVCECVAGNDNPLCDTNPMTGTPSIQARAKAHPGLRQLAVLRGIGPQAVVASICPAQISDQEVADYGHRPAMQAIFDRWKARR